MPIIYVTATRTVTYKETTTKEIKVADIANIEQCVKDIRNGDNLIFFDDVVWDRVDYNISDPNIESIKAEIQY